MERMRSSTTVDATGSNPAVGSSYMMTCSRNRNTHHSLLHNTWILFCSAMDGVSFCAEAWPHTFTTEQHSNESGNTRIKCCRYLTCHTLSRFCCPVIPCTGGRAYMCSFENLETCSFLHHEPCDQSGGHLEGVHACSALGCVSSATIARARATRLRIPPLSSDGSSFSTPLSPTAPRLSATSSCRKHASRILKDQCAKFPTQYLVDPV